MQVYQLKFKILKTSTLSISCPCAEISAWWWLLLTETYSKFYIVEYIVVFWLNDFVVSTTTQRDGSYQITWW